MPLLLIFSLLFGLPFGASATTDCRALSDAAARVSDPIRLISESEFVQNAQKNQKGFGLYLFSWANVQQLCSSVDLSKQRYCLDKSASILNEALSCLNEELLVNETRPLAWSFLRNPELEALMTGALFEKASSMEELNLQKGLWQKYRILLLPAQVKTGVGLTKAWRIQDLKQIEKSYEKLMVAVTNAVGPQKVLEYSHVWGAGGILARVGELSVSGQFGEVYADYPMQINVVIDVLKEKKSAAQLAQQLAHENAHSNDHLRGRLLTGRISSWSETSSAQIFWMCGLEAHYETSLMPCFRLQPQWFNFHSTSYPARRSAEFYTKMVDQWVRENLGLSKKKPYRCQNAQTLFLWNEMELNLLGEVNSKVCDPSH